MQFQDTLFVLGAQPFAEGRLIGSLVQAQQVQEHPVAPQPLGIGQRDSAAGESKEQLGHNGLGHEALVFADARVQVLALAQTAPKVEPLAEGLDENSAAVGAGLLGVGDLESVPALLFAKGVHGRISS